MTANRILTFILLSLFLTASASVQAQTQEDIMRMMNGETETSEQTDDGEDSSTRRKKKEKKRDRAAEDVEEPAESAEDAVDDAEEAVDDAVREAEETTDEALDGSTDDVIDAGDDVEDSANETMDEAGDDAGDAMEAIPDDTDEARNAMEEADDAAEVSETRSRGSGGRSEMDLMKPYRTWTISVGGHVTSPGTDIRYRDFFGTLDPKNENQWGASIAVTKMFDASFGVQLNASYNVLQGVFDTLVRHQEDKEYLEEQGFGDGVYFRNNVIAGSARIYWNISNTIFGMNRYYKANANGGPIRPRRFSLYTTAGLGLTGFDPHLMELSDDAPYESEANPDAIRPANLDQSLEVYIPFSLGVKFNLGKAMDLGIEYGLNFVLTDKLDGVVYDHPNRLSNDFYSQLGVTLHFKTGTKKKSSQHIEWINPVEPILNDLDAVKRDVRGLTRDSDGDGVADMFDEEDDTPEGVTVSGAGEALDSDGDGIPDHADLEPFSDKNVEVDEFGQAIDSDGDGVADHMDEEPNTEDGKLVNFQGMTIENHLDLPEDGPGEGIYLPSIYFDTDRSEIKRDFEDDLFQVARIMKRAEGLNFVIAGHCDERGSEEYNYELGKRRAEAARDYLVENYGIDAGRLTIVSKGKEAMDGPRYSINRRVDFRIAD